MDKAPIIDPEPNMSRGHSVRGRRRGADRQPELVRADHVPFGSFKDSGLGRQNGIAGFDQYLETKSLAWPSA